MEAIRVFERKCLRYCHGAHRSADTNFQQYISNQIQYNEYGSDRIDVHILDLVRNHIRRSTGTNENSLVYGPYYTEDHINRQNSEIGKNPGPETFTYLDRKRYIQDFSTKWPIIYHTARRQNVKGFDSQIFDNRLDIHRPDIDRHKYNNNERAKPIDTSKYWWLREIQEPP